MDSRPAFPAAGAARDNAGADDSRPDMPEGGAEEPIADETENGAPAEPGAGTDVRPEKRGEPLGLDAVKAGWDALLEAMARTHPADVRHLARISVAGVRDDVVILAGGSMAIEAWEDQRRLGRLREAAAEVLARPVGFEFRVEAGKTAPGDGAREDGAAFRLARHPAVERVKELFDGVVADYHAAGSEAGCDGGEESAGAWR